MRKIIKKIWKIVSRPLLKLYVGDYSLIIKNELIHFNHSYSQFGQDVFLLDTLLKDKKDGFFVDVGGNDPIIGNNTYLLERNGWTGLAFEPQPELNKKWSESRITRCLPYAIGDKEGLVCFAEGLMSLHGLSGISGFNKINSDNAKTYTVQQYPLSKILEEKNITKIDYLSIDVEGYEMNVLKGIDFDACDINIIDIENDIGFKKIPFIGKYLGSTFGDNKLRVFLKKNGYKYTARIMCDDFFVKIVK